ncbi:hypothetical protein L1987_46255 [Smallanthus sonchifolius]|uniref:Uncharacterized protein n=1 Tax=Smallanthus sonchifolius TaxID=185202 RepID=A0ACB9G071_9ASTR|nr:hypothetical protein L1987_46255 [Smallanthus sonchifolius]
MPGFDPENGKLVQRVLINPQKIDYHTGVFATNITPAKDGKPVTIELIDAKTKEPKYTLENLLKKKPWKHSEPIKGEQLKRMHDELWDTAPHYGGRKGYCFITIQQNNKVKS